MTDRAAQEQRIRDKVACEKAVYDMQWRLLDGAICADVLAAAAELLQPEHYDDVVCERGIDGQCGYPGCGNPVKKRGAGSRYHVSLSEHKVYDRSTMREFCSNDCARRSQEYARGLSTVSLFLRKGAVAVQAAPAAGAGEPAATAAAAPAAAAPAAAAPSAPSAPADATPAAATPAATGAGFRSGDIMVGQIAERTDHGVPRPPQPPPRPDLVEGYPTRWSAPSAPPGAVQAAGVTEGASEDPVN